MDKNTIIGLVLMGVVLVVFSILGRPSQEELELRQRYADSVALAAQARERAMVDSLDRIATEDSLRRSATLAQYTPAERDSILTAQASETFGPFAPSAHGREQTFTIANDSLSVTLSTKGGKPIASEILGYDDYQGVPIQLIRPDDSRFSLTLFTSGNRVVRTEDLYFVGEQVSPTQVKMSAMATNGSSLTLVYTLRPKYIIDVTIAGTGDFKSVMAPNSPFLDADISLPVYRNEKSEQAEQRYSGMAYEFTDGDVDKLNTGKSEDKELTNEVKWVAFRDMFFSTIVYSRTRLGSLAVSQEMVKGDPQKLKEMEAKFVLPFDGTQPISLQIYNGPNDHALLKSLDKNLGDKTHLTEVIDMGRWFRFITVWVVLPVFNFLEKYISNYGLIIILLTLIIKLILAPFTFKSFKSQAKMRAIKPLVDEINAKYPGEDKMMERNKATMQLYQNAGVNVMGGCLPMLLQMPILIAMYQYFPTSLNLRGESFLWAQDLSTYDDVIRWGADIPMIGDHISLFCLLMTVTQIIYMRLTQSGTAGGDQQSACMMKAMPIFMSVFLFFFLNNNASGLSLYYFASLLISILQTKAFQWSIDEQKLFAQLQENAKKPKKKKQSGFMERLEKAQKEQMKKLREQQQRNGR